MRNRWHHIPMFHLPHGHSARRVGWLELFYDLIFVAAFIVLGNALSHHLTWVGFAVFSLTFSSLWLVWSGTTFLMNRYQQDDILHRILILTQMFLIGGLAISGTEVLEGHLTRFSLFMAGCLILIAVGYLRGWAQQQFGRPYAYYWGAVFLVATIPFALAPLLPPLIQGVCWGVGLLIVFVGSFTKTAIHLGHRFPTDLHHLSERFGLLTLIVLGESFVKVVSSLHSTPDMGSLLQAGFALLITCCLWWVYFDDIAGSDLKEIPFALPIWIFSHLPFHLFLTAAGVGIYKATTLPLHTTVPSKYAFFIAGTLACALLGVTLIDAVTKRKQSELRDGYRVAMRAISGVLLLLLAIAPATPGPAFLGGLIFIMGAQVLFDLIMAPLEAAEITDAIQTHTLAQQANKTDPAVPLTTSKTIRLGTPNAFRKDLYFFLMEGSWARTFVIALGLFLSINAFFAGLYLIDPSGISGVGPYVFWDAFCFSVQTMSTIGYGALHPTSVFINTIVVGQAAIGLFFTALITGLVFAKASRPKASVLFSKVMTIAPRFGVPTLSFRVGNARGNDVVDAQITVSLLIDEITPEGDHIRRIHDMQLSRNRSPFFGLTWSVMHIINEDSPLYGMDLSNPKFISIMAVLTGHDGTYGQTIYARHMYAPSDLKNNHTFTDVMSQRPDGQLVINFHLFHDTQALR